jgi:hypothetical protein
MKQVYVDGYEGGLIDGYEKVIGSSMRNKHLRSIRMERVWMKKQSTWHQKWISPEFPSYVIDANRMDTKWIEAD